MIECRRMTEASRADAFSLLRIFLDEDSHYLDSSQVYGASGDSALETALSVFLQVPELGFVWLAYEDGRPVAVCVVCLAISTSIGGIVAKLDDVFVLNEQQRRGIGSIHLTSLKAELQELGVRRIDTSVHMQNNEARRFYERHGFSPLKEERLACLL